MRVPRLLLNVAAKKITIIATFGCILLTTLGLTYQKQITNIWQTAFNNDQSITQLYFTQSKALPLKLSPHEQSQVSFSVQSNRTYSTPFIVTELTGSTSTVLASGVLQLDSNQTLIRTIPFTMPDNGPALITVSLPQLQQSIRFHIKEVE